MSRRKDGQRAASTTGRVRNVPVDMSNWREQLQRSRIKFDDVQKNLYLRVLSETGRKTQAALAAGVGLNTVKTHLDIDPDFAEAFELALEQYRDRVHDIAQSTYDGRLKKPILGGQFKDEVVAHETIIHANILAMELKRVDPSYRDRSEIDMNVKGGVLVVPDASETKEEYLARIKREQEELQQSEK
jgi:hypothetical protein